jgi:hypothetical protein
MELIQHAEHVRDTVDRALRASGPKHQLTPAWGDHFDRDFAVSPASVMGPAVCHDLGTTGSGR